ncbi:TlpA family protein disulfide reductase [Flavivirga spongiicola]|uniref:TlpA family protein disulfide reductase n=1 Tax=Flavivirga spongiicola TaxID=421621 RepID=A0ABU7XS68_9FLAO|nr:TlpA disulfide reductase family protein [Flavivirga sp. MEBiC05379]MDO5978376.1 TlpA disulfide reductase family protein [Flavivirga sp. MEBiC05379]
MKYILYLFIALTYINLCYSQEKEYATLSGKIMNADLDSLQITSLSGFKKTIKVNNDGFFKDTLKVGNFNTFTLSLRKRDQNQTLYLKNGYDLNLAVSLEGYNNSISFLGKGATINNYLMAKAQNTSAIKGDDFLKFLSLKEDEFTKKVETIKNNNLELLNDIANIDSDFNSFEIENISYEELNDYVFYYFMKKNKTAFSNDKNSQEYIPPKGFMPDKFFNFKFDNESLYKNSLSYNQICTITLIRDFNIRNSKNEITKKYLDSVFKKIKIGALKNEMAIQFSRLLSITKKTAEAKTYYNYFMSRNDLSKETKLKLKALYEPKEIKSVVSVNTNDKEVKKGELSPKFDYKNHIGETTSLDDLKGKYVYIDIWATWCGPCKKEIPFLKNVEKQYHGKNITFVSISVDEKYAFNTWENMVKEKELTGVQLFANNAFNSKFIKDYKVRSIPRFILIDPEGKLVDAYAPRPSDEKLLELFNSLNI